MIISQDHNHGEYEVHSYEPGQLKINDTVYNHSVIISPKELLDWPPQQFKELQAQNFEVILALKPEVVLIGTGEHLSFPDQVLLSIFYKAEIGVEVMTTLAACRTFNVLMSESRNVVAGLLIR